MGTTMLTVPSSPTHPLRSSLPGTWDAMRFRPRRTWFPAVHPPLRSRSCRGSKQSPEVLPATPGVLSGHRFQRRAGLLSRCLARRLPSGQLRGRRGGRRRARGRGRRARTTARCGTAGWTHYRWDRRHDAARNAYWRRFLAVPGDGRSDWRGASARHGLSPGERRPACVEGRGRAAVRLAFRAHPRRLVPWRALVGLWSLRLA
jgi:hypothetical protein